MSKKLFGTDGIRGVAGQPPLDDLTVFIAGLCLGHYLKSHSSEPRVIIGEDPRESSTWIAETIAAGLNDAGVASAHAGVLTTPGLAHLTTSERFDAGVMISASHNPYTDNGIKVFASSGYKFPDDAEKIVEDEILRILASNHGLTPRRIPMAADRALVRKYVDYLRASAGTSWNLTGQKLVIDCANGAACGFAKEVFSDYGLELKIVANQPDGRNINLNCGSLHLENLQRIVVAEHADVGVAFDGDADRALFVSKSGKIVDGDGVLLAASRYMKAQGTLKGGAVVGTVMTNLGLEHALAREGLRLLRTPVGDKYVLEEMLRAGANLGGEQSGHVIFRDLATTGDGLLTALQVLKIIAEQRKPLDELIQGLEVFPQTIRNVRVRTKVPLETLAPVMEQIRASERHLGDSGRIVVRYSGTELLCRVMVEAQSADDVEQNASAIVRALEQSIGSA
jgi:phosphoglucosamine mutase